MDLSADDVSTDDERDVPVDCTPQNQLTPQNYVAPQFAQAITQTAARSVAPTHCQGIPLDPKDMNAQMMPNMDIQTTGMQMMPNMGIQQGSMGSSDMQMIPNMGIQQGSMGSSDMRMPNMERPVEQMPAPAMQMPGVGVLPMNFQAIGAPTPSMSFPSFLPVNPMETMNMTGGMNAGWMPMRLSESMFNVPDEAYMPSTQWDQGCQWDEQSQWDQGSQEQLTRRPRRRGGKKQRKEPTVGVREDSFKCFVGGLAPHTTSSVLRTYFENFGTVADAMVVVDKETGKGKGFGFVEFPGELPVGLFDQKHLIDNRSCNVRAYNYAATR